MKATTVTNLILNNHHNNELECYLIGDATPVQPSTTVYQTDHTVHAILEEPKTKRQASSLPLSGPELAAMMKIGTRVVKGIDWKWGDQVPKRCSVFSVGGRKIKFHPLNIGIGMFEGTHTYFSRQKACDA